MCLCSFLFGCTLKLFCSFHFFIAATQPSTDWHLKENAREHHTSKFSSEELIVRRGQAFTITFNGAERPEQNLVFIAETGMAPSFFSRDSNAASGHSSGPICTTEQQEKTSEPTCSFTAKELCEVFVVLLLPQPAATASSTCQYLAQIHLRGGLGGLHLCWVRWWLNLYFSMAWGKKKYVICFSWKVQNPQRQPRPWPRLISPAQWARRAGVQLCSPAAPALWASPFPAHTMLSLDVTGWVSKVAAPLHKVLALLFCFLTLGLQVWICWISSKDLCCF